MIAIIIPTYKQATELTHNEKLSLFQTSKVFNNYDLFLVTNSEVATSLYQPLTCNGKKLQSIYFDRLFFEGLEGYNKLLMSLEFYKTFKKYRYLLICQLDVFVFYDNLNYFIQKKIDYIGAPWFDGYNNATKNSNIIGAGNGGFSLRKISSSITVLNILGLFKQSCSLNISQIISSLTHPVSFLKVYKNQYLRKRKNYLSLLPDDFPHYEDIFWASYVPQAFPWFKVAEVNDAISFSFEVNPELLYEMNNKKLPMATHAWEKYGENFWQPFIEDYRNR